MSAGHRLFSHTESNRGISYPVYKPLGKDIGFTFGRCENALDLQAPVMIWASIADLMKMISRSSK